MSKITQKGTAKYIHRLFHKLAKKYKIDVDKIAEIIEEWEEKRDEHNYIVKQISKRYGKKNN